MKIFLFYLKLEFCIESWILRYLPSRTLTELLQDSETGTNEVIRIKSTMLRELRRKDFNFRVSQVYPVPVGRTDRILCLATQFATLLKSLEDVKVSGDGVDYLLGTCDL